MLPIYLLMSIKGQPLLVELKSGETINGNLESVDNWMNIVLKDAVKSDVVGDQFSKVKEIYVKGTQIKCLRMSNEIIDRLKEQHNKDNYQHNRNHSNNNNYNNYNNNRGGNNNRFNNRGGRGGYQNNNNRYNNNNNQNNNQNRQFNQSRGGYNSNNNSRDRNNNNITNNA